MNSTTTSTRIFAIDALRGFALAGVAIVHMGEQYIGGPTPEGVMEGISYSWVDYIVMGITNLFIRGKFFALFSILFGLSFSLQMDRAAKRGENFSLRFLWRAVLLFSIGYVHQLFYRGDILTIYAMLTPFLIPFYRLEKKWILIASAFFLFSIPRLLVFPFLGNTSAFGIHAPMEVAAPAVKTYFEVIQTGTLGQVFALNADYGMRTKMDFQIGFGGRFYLTLGYFLLGLWIGKMGLLHQLEAYKDLFRKILKWSALALIPITAIIAILFTIAPQPFDFTHFLHALGINFAEWINIALTLVILSAFLILYQRQKWEKALNFFVPYGRMALTNYVLQSVIGTYLLFGWGLGYLNQFSQTVLFLMALLLVVLQTLFSRFWLQNFKYGPLEWLWRSATFFKFQPIKPPALSE
ncbi:MAG: DUF418 domain-containing protein [Bacteroidota bacterium]